MYNFIFHSFMTMIMYSCFFSVLDKFDHDIMELYRMNRYIKDHNLIV